MGRSTRAYQAGTYESVYDVDGWQFNLHISYYDGGHDGRETHSGLSLFVTE